MQLSSQEAEAFAGIEKRRRATRALHWVLVAIGFVVFGIDLYTDWFGSVDVEVSTVALIVSIQVFIFACFDTVPTPNQRLIGLLRRYVNNDAEALKQVIDSRARA